MRKTLDIRKLTMLGTLSALAYVIMLVGRIPLISIPALILKYDPKDVVIAVGGLLFGPLPALGMAVTVSFVEMLTVSVTGWIGFAMNVVSTSSFACTAAWIYKKRTLRRAMLGLGMGWLCMTGVMLLWNYGLTPIYTGVPRAAVAEMLLPVFLPFNLLKGGLNGAITMLVYKPLSMALRRTGLILSVDTKASPRANLGVILLCTALLATGLWLILQLTVDS